MKLRNSGGEKLSPGGDEEGGQAEKRRVLSKPTSSDSGKSNEAGDPPLPDPHATPHRCALATAIPQRATELLVAGPGGWNFVSPLCHISSAARHRPTSFFFLLSSASTKFGRDETAGSAHWISAFGREHADMPWRTLPPFQGPM